MRASRQEDLFTGLTLKNDPMMSVDSAFGAWGGSFLVFQNKPETSCSIYWTQNALMFADNSRLNFHHQC